MQISGMPEGLIWPQFEDGTPVNIGDYVLNGYGNEVEAKFIHFSHDGCWRISDLARRVAILGNGEKCKRPFHDSWEKLEIGAKGSMENYWDCKGYGCGECPSKINGKTPDDFFQCGSCSVAKQLDIVRRAKKIAEHERNEQ